MATAELFALLIVAPTLWFWFDSSGARETAVAIGKRACASEGVLLLDDTVALSSLGLRRDGRGQLQLMRSYEFEFSDTGNNRLCGTVTLFGRELQTVYLEPHAGAQRPQNLPN
jgi:hypothetical protein